MPTSLRKLTEQSARLYARRSGRTVTKDIDKVEIRQFIIQVINRIISAQKQQADDDKGIPACIIATYESVSTSSSACTLPAQPIVLPRDRGIDSVGPDDETSERYIPITAEEWNLFRSMSEGGLEGIIGYYREGNTIRFTSTPPATVRIKLLVVDPAVLGLDDVLPIGADMEDIVVEEVANKLAKYGASE